MPISENVSISKLQNKHIVIATTGYTSGQLHAFFISDLLDIFCAQDSKLASLDQRLAHFRRIQDQNTLTATLLASAAIPYFFPPVAIGDDWHIDGGIGNNTPTREAAYFFRYLDNTGCGIVGDVYCIKQDKPGILQQGPTEYAVKQFILRTLDVYHYVHMEPILRAWIRINKEVTDHDAKVGNFVQWLNGLGLSATQLNQITTQIKQTLGHLGGTTARINVPLVEITPSVSLGDALDFTQEKIRRNIQTGFLDTLKELLSLKKIDKGEFDQIVSDTKLY